MYLRLPRTIGGFDGACCAELSMDWSAVSGRWQGNVMNRATNLEINEQVLL
jgi:hypothetical protein